MILIIPLIIVASLVVVAVGAYLFAEFILEHMNQ